MSFYDDEDDDLPDGAFTENELAAGIQYLARGTDRGYLDDDDLEDFRPTREPSYFKTSQEATAWAKNNPGRAFTKSPDGNGYIVKGTLSGSTSKNIKEQKNKHSGISPRYYSGKLIPLGTAWSDLHTGLTWCFPPGDSTVDATGGDKIIAIMNRTRLFGYSDWRLPSIKELRSLEKMYPIFPSVHLLWEISTEEEKKESCPQYRLECYRHECNSMIEKYQGISHPYNIRHSRFISSDKCHILKQCFKA